MSSGDAMSLVLGVVAPGGGASPSDARFGAGLELPSEAAPVLPSRSPRRTKQIQFTCNRCGVRTARMVNPNAIETGTVFLQCSGCLVQHRLVDNLNLFPNDALPSAAEGAREGEFRIEDEPRRFDE